MEQELKQRIVGAVVLTALAAIFLPMLFDDPIDESAQRINQIGIPDIPEALKLNNSGIPQSTEDVLKRPAQPSFKRPQNAKSLERWFIQTGLFSQYDNAVTQRNKLIKQGYNATIENTIEQNKKVYKVTVGPELSKDRAKAVKTEIDQANQLTSFVLQK